MIFDLTPYRTDKNIGRAYNERIKVLPDDAWIILRDPDTMYLTPNAGTIIEKVIKEHGEKFALFTALTNRLGVKEYCLNGEFSEDFDLLNHIEKAKSQMVHSEIKEVKLAAGFFLMFKKSTWEKLGKFKENSITTDRDFSAKIISHNLKIGQIQSLYLFHLYRPWKSDHVSAWHSINHLL